MATGTCWRDLIQQEMSEHGESWSDVMSIAPIDLELSKKFDSGYGGTEGRPFTIWTEKRVYFPAVYDGAEWCASVARHPDGKPTYHVGSG